LNDLDLYEAPEVASKMLVAAMGLIGTVTSEQRAHLWLSMEDPARQDWDIIPRPEHTRRHRPGHAAVPAQRQGPHRHAAGA
jgi:hypothetical protein